VPRADNPTIHVPIVLKSGSLNLLEPSGLVQACNGIALPFTNPCPTLMYRLRLPSSFVLTIRLGIPHSSVGIVARLLDIRSGVRFPTGAKDFSVLGSVQTGFVIHPASY